MKQASGEGRWWLAGLGLLALVWAGGATRAESLPVAAWAFDLLARVEAWRPAEPLAFLSGLATTRHSLPTAAQARLQANYGRLPLHFEPNVGQSADAVQFLARGPGYTLFLTADEAVLALRPGRPVSDRVKPHAPQRPFDLAARTPDDAPAVPGAVIRTRLEGATRNPAAHPEGLDRQPGISNYFLGNDPAKWRTNVPHYQRVRYPNVYPGIDLVYYGDPQRLEHDFIVAPGADPAMIQLAISGAEEATVNAEGDLVLKVPGGEVVQQAPRIYQVIDGKQQAVAGRYVLRDTVSGALPTVSVATAEPTSSPFLVGFEVVQYDRNQSLVIDPILVYSTYLGGTSGEYGTCIAVDSAGNAYYTGVTWSTDFPTANALYPNYSSGGWVNPGGDAYVFKINANGSAAVYSTYLGGSGIDWGYGIAVDSAGNAYVTGVTQSTDFPTVNALYSNLGGTEDAFIFKINANGSAAVYSTYLGGSGVDGGFGMAVDSLGNTYVTGDTESTDFPMINALYPNLGGTRDAFIFKLNANGLETVYSTYLGGSGVDGGSGIAVDSFGNAYVTGVTDSTDFPTANALYPNNWGEEDAFIFKLNANGSAAVYSTYLGGSDVDRGFGMAVDSLGNAYVTGDTQSTDFPTVNALYPNLGGYRDAFIFKLDASGSAAVYSTYLGGSDGEWGDGIAVDSLGNAYVTGYTSSTDFPTVNALYSNLGGTHDAFIFKLDASGSAAVYSTYLGGSVVDEGTDIAVDSLGNAYVTGATSSTDFPTVNALYLNYGGGLDAFVTKLNITATAQYTVGLYNPLTNTFYLRTSHSAGVADISYRYGPANAGWTPLVGDWDSNGTATAGLYNPATGTFYLRNSNSAGVANITYRFGPAGAGWIPLVGDWDGNGTATAGLYNLATSTFYLRNSHSGGVAHISYRYGSSGRNWIPLVGDWDGNGTDTVGLFDPTTSAFYLKNSHSGGVADVRFRYGPSGRGWKPLTGDWDGDGTDTVGLFDPAASAFYLRNSHSSGVADISYRYGPANADWTPLVGDWNGPRL